MKWILTTNDCKMHPYFKVDPVLYPLLIKYRDIMFKPGMAMGVYKNRSMANSDLCETFTSIVSKTFHDFCHVEKFVFTDSHMKQLRSMFKSGYTDKEIINQTFECWITYTHAPEELSRKLFP